MKCTLCDSDSVGVLMFRECCRVRSEGKEMDNAFRVYVDVLNELRGAIRQHTEWPADPIHAMAILGEEYGELNQAIVQQVYEPEKNNNGLDDVRNEAIQTAAMAIRFLVNFDKYSFNCRKY